MGAPIIDLARSLAAGLLMLSAPLAAAPLSPNAGTFSGEGVLDDGDGNKGSWRASGTLSGGNIAGTLSVDLAGKTMTVPMKPGPAYMQNGRCILKGEEGRNRFELSGDCDSDSFGPGYINGYFAGGPSVSGKFAGTLRWGSTAATSNGAAAATPAAGTIPTARLLCGYRERVGGVVAGDLPTYENRQSLMGFLQLSSDGTYRTAQGSGRFSREGDAIRLASGPWQGALGRLKPDNGGDPAVYFEREDNRRPDGSPIIDPWRTFCVQQNR